MRARNRERSPSGTSGRAWKSRSATTILSTPSPRNSSRSLFGLPQLRWVSASRSRSGRRKSCPSPLSVEIGRMSVERLDTLDRDDRIELADQVLAHLVLGDDFKTATANDFNITRRDMLDVTGREFPRQQVAQTSLGHVGNVRFFRQALHGRDDRVVVEIDGDQLHGNV